MIKLLSLKLKILNEYESDCIGIQAERYSTGN